MLVTFKTNQKMFIEDTGYIYAYIIYLVKMYSTNSYLTYNKC